MKKWPSFIIIFTLSAIVFAGAAEAAANYYAYVLSWGSWGSGNGQFLSPRGAAMDASGNIYVADYNNRRIQKFDQNGNYLAQWATSGLLPTDVAMDSAGNIYVAGNDSSGGGHVQKFDPGGSYLTQWGSSGGGNGQFWYPDGVAVDASGYVYVPDQWGNRIQKFTSTGAFVAKWGSSGSGSGQFNGPTGVAADSSGNIYVVDSSNNRIEKFTSGGAFLAAWGSSGSGSGQFNFTGQGGVAVDAAGNVYVSDSGNHRIQEFDPNGAFLAQWGYTGYEPFGGFNPQGIAVGITGNTGNLYIADSYNDSIRKYGTPFVQNYTVTPQAGTGSTLTATFVYKDAGGVVHPLDHAYVYLQAGSELSPRERYFKSAQYILGPTDASGYISASVPAGVYHVRFTRRTPLSSTPTRSQAYGPPRPGDYTWNAIGSSGSTITVPAGSIVSFGTVYASLFGQQASISGRVTSSSGAAVAGVYVVAMPSPCSKAIGEYRWSGVYSCKGTNYPAQALTDSGGNYTIKLRNPGTYYVYAMPRPEFYAGSKLPWPTCGSCNDAGTIWSDCNACLSYEAGRSSGWPASNWCMPYCPITVGSGANVTGQNITNYNNTFGWPYPNGN
ncbi:MAG: hypothetical protein M0Z75_05050 [Nitrospiraceae bacterium]|nr:hypothetical protein [Nitrospiraceae bacterium]